MGILKQLAAGGATTVMHGLASEQELRQKADAVAAQYGTRVGTSSANLLRPEEIRYWGVCVWVCSIVCVTVTVCGRGLGGRERALRTWWFSVDVRCWRPPHPHLTLHHHVPPLHCTAPPPCREMVQRVQAEFGRLDILVNK